MSDCYAPGSGVRLCAALRPAELARPTVSVKAEQAAQIHHSMAKQAYRHICISQPCSGVHNVLSVPDVLNVERRGPSLATCRLNPVSWVRMDEQQLNEILLVDKPAGITSHDVVDRVRRIFKTRRVGHAGTLDPFATGLLIIGVGKATKELNNYVGLDKTYIATARLGATSDTYDLEGIIVARPMSNIPCHDEVLAVLGSFRGGYDQIAPAYSAKKVNGKKLYELARKGEDVEHLRPTKKINISEIELISYKWPDLKFLVSCSSGTYIRSLAHDIGEKLGCGAYLTELRRTRIGEYKIEDAKTLEDLKTTQTN